MKHVYDKVLKLINIDERLETGIFDVSNDLHLEIFREYLEKENIPQDDIISASNKLAEAGKHPERQAYNKNGILVTFPTPEYKARALKNGTHFDENPKKAQVNIFGGEVDPTNPAPQATSTAPETIPPATAQAPAPAPAPATPETPAPVPAVDPRKPEERKQDADVVVKMLTTGYTLDEALNFGFYSKNGIWYNPEGKYIGKMWFVENLKKQLILP